MNENGVQKGLSKLKSGKLLEILFISIIIVIVAIVLYNFLSRDRTEKNGSSDYGEALARELEETLSAIQGAGGVTVYGLLRSRMGGMVRHVQKRVPDGRDAWRIT